MKRFLISVSAVAMAFAMYADQYIYLTKNDVNLRESPSTTSPVVTKGKRGTIFVVEETKAGWYKGQNPQYGNTPVWISATVAKEQYVDNQIPAWSMVTMPEATVPYEEVKRYAAGEDHTVWTFTSSNPDFWRDEKPGSAFDALRRITSIKNNGSIRSYEKFYKGLAYPYYLILTEESDDYGSGYEKLEAPIYIYPGIDAESGVYVDGAFYRDLDVLDGEW